jgi:hypothetical protein
VSDGQTAVRCGRDCHLVRNLGAAADGKVATCRIEAGNRGGVTLSVRAATAAVRATISINSRGARMPIARTSRHDHREDEPRNEIRDRP